MRKCMRCGRRDSAPISCEVILNTPLEYKHNERESMTETQGASPPWRLLVVNCDVDVED